MEQPAGMHLAQLNVARALDAMDSPRLADFMSALDRVNAVAERSPGFVWRLKGDTGNATNIQTTTDARFIVNISVWETPTHLEHFVWNTIHKQVYVKKSKWFETPAEATFVMWWVPADHRPTTDEALTKLDDLRTRGPSAAAFGWESLPHIRLWMNQRCG
jgi:Domain of unknown function (DUF3291)